MNVKTKVTGTAVKTTGQFEDGSEEGHLPAWFLGTDKSNLHILAAMGAGGRDNHRAAHDALGNSGDHRIDVVQSAVKCIQTVFNL